MQFASVNGVTLHYQMIGSPEDKPLLVFANSLGTDFRIWRDVIVRLAGDFAILTYDKRGHGLSGVGLTPYTMNDHAADLIGLLELIGADRAVFCGLSVGGMIAQAVYGMKPELVRGLILCDTAHKIGTFESWTARIETVEAGGIETIADKILATWFTPEFRRPGNPDYDGYRNMLVRQPRDGYVATCAALRDADLTEIAKAIAVPTVCVVGDQDGSTPPALMAEFARLIPNSNFELIRDAGHIPCVEQPEILAEIIRAFVALIGTETSSHVAH